MNDLGKIPPQNIEAETAVLGAALIEKDALDNAMLMVQAGMFYDERHNLIFDACVKLKASHKPVDILTITEFLRHSGKLEYIGGAYYLVELTNSVASAANITAHAAIIQQLYIKRELIKLGTKIIKDAYDESVDGLELSTTLMNEFGKIATHYIGANTITADEVMQQKVESVQNRLLKPQTAKMGLNFGIKAIDTILGGLYGSDLIIVAARPAMGKTAALLTCLRHNIKLGKKAGIFSLEMSAKQLVDRLIAMETGIPVNILRAEHLISEHQLNQIESTRQFWATAITMGKLLIDDTAGLDIEDIKIRSSRWKQEHGVELIGVDYIQLAKCKAVQSMRGNREQEVSQISQGLKAVAKTCDVPVIALCQLSRAVELRGGDKRPQLSDLRESGGIEQDSDIVMFPYRYAVYTNEDAEIELGNGQRVHNSKAAEFIVAKNRQGEVGNAFCEYIGHQTMFRNLDEEEATTTNYKPMAKHFSEPSKDDDLPF